MTLMKAKTITLVTLILCAICIAPVMAGTRTEIIEDGVHFLKADDASTVLNPQIYRKFIDEDFVVDGNQFYWIRIGNVKAKQVSSNDIAKYLCLGSFLVGGAIAGAYVGSATTAAIGTETTLSTLSITIASAEGLTVANIVQKTPKSVQTWTINALSGGVSSAVGMLSGLCDNVEKWFVDNNFRVVASDGTILIGIKKDNTIGIQELKKQGIDIQKLTHLSKDGNIIRDL